MSDDWIASFHHLLEMANEKEERRQATIDNIKALKLAGISKSEAGLLIASELVAGGGIAYAAIYQMYLNEVYGETIKESTS